MASATSNQPSVHEIAMVQVLKESNALLKVPKATLMHVYTDPEVLAQDIEQEIDYLAAESTDGIDSPPGGWPHYRFDEHVEYLTEFPSGFERAIGLVRKHGKDYYEFWGKDMVAYSNDIDHVQIELDTLALRLHVAKVACWTPAQLQQWEPDLDFEGTLGGHTTVHRDDDGGYSPSVPVGWARFTADCSKQLLEKHMWPRTLRYLRTMHARKTAHIVVPKVAGHLLSQELVDMILDFSYDKAFAAAPVTICAAEDAEAERIREEKRKEEQKMWRQKQVAAAAASNQAQLPVELPIFTQGIAFGSSSGASASLDPDSPGQSPLHVYMAPSSDGAPATGADIQP